VNVKRTTSSIGKIGILLTLVLSILLVSEAKAQEYCECVDTYRTTSVRRAPVRHSVKAYRAKRVNKVRRATTAYQPVYQTVYVPVRRVVAVPASQYVDADDDCDDDEIAYTTANTRVYVTDRVYANGHNGKRVYTNAYNGNKVYVNGYNGNNRTYVNGRFGNIAVDPNYYQTQRIASDYGYRDGYIDGRDAGMERDNYNPENSGDFQKATNGYEDDFGPKDLYRQAYRSAYLRGYDAGFRTVAQSQTYRANSRW